VPSGETFVRVLASDQNPSMTISFTVADGRELQEYGNVISTLLNPDDMYEPHHLQFIDQCTVRLVYSERSPCFEVYRSGRGCILPSRTTDDASSVHREAAPIPISDEEDYDPDGSGLSDPPRSSRETTLSKTKQQQNETLQAEVERLHGVEVDETFRVAEERLIQRPRVVGAMVRCRDKLLQDDQRAWLQMPKCAVWTLPTSQQAASTWSDHP
jgi:hypothetical protein